MKNLLILVLLFTSSIAFSQTDIIEMRSRNVSLDSYTKTSNAKKIDRVHSNFGLDPSLDRNRLGPADIPVFLSPKPHLDSVKNLQEKGVVLFVREQCEKSLFAENSIREVQCPTHTDTVSQKLFQHNASLDSFKAVLFTEFFYSFDMDSTRYIDFEETQAIQQEEMLPKKKNEKQNSIGWELIFMLVTPILFAFGVNRWIIPKSLITK